MTEFFYLVGLNKHHVLASFVRMRGRGETHPLLHMLHNVCNDVHVSAKKTSERGARLEVPGACNGLSACADGGKPQQAAQRALETERVEHPAAEPSEVPPGLRSTPPEEITHPVERACLLEVFLSAQK